MRFNVPLLSSLQQAAWQTRLLISSKDGNRFSLDVGPTIQQQCPGSDVGSLFSVAISHLVYPGCKVQYWSPVDLVASESKLAKTTLHCLQHHSLFLTLPTFTVIHGPLIFHFPCILHQPHNVDCTFLIVLKAWC